MSKELKITKEKVLKASETCPDAKSVLKELFPGVFIPPKKKWKDITKEIEVRVRISCAKPSMDNKHYLSFMHEGEQIAYSGYTDKDIQFISLADDTEEYKIEWDGINFIIFKKN